MGIPIEPPEYGNDCLQCFPAGQTPLVLYLTIEGMLTGQLWTPADPPPPNGTFELVQTGDPCTFWQLDPPFLFEHYLNTPLKSILVSFAGEVDPTYINSIIQPCTYSGVNQSQAPAGEHYYGGAAQVAFVPPSPSPSLTDIATALGLTTQDEVKAAFWPSAPDWTVRLASFKVPTNIMIKQEN